MPDAHEVRDLAGTVAIHPSKRDWLLVLIIWGIIGVTIASGVKVVQEATNPMLAFAFLVFCGAIVMFMLTILYTTHYTISGDRLAVRCGPFRYSISLPDIEEVVPSRNPLSSPALSLDRLHISYRGSMFGLLISPRDKQMFLADLVARAPHLRIDGGRAVSGGHQ